MEKAAALALAQKQVKANKDQKKQLTPKQIADFMAKIYEREQHGKYTLIFPFSNLSEQLSVELNKQSASLGRGGDNVGMGNSVGSKANINMSGPNHMKQLINEIKQYYDDRAAFMKSQKRY